YATFLRKRLEKADRPPDELETINKLLSGLERAAADTTMLVRYGRPLELRRAPRTDLSRILAAAEGDAIETESGTYEGEFDAAALTEALKNIAAGARPVEAAAGGAASAPETSAVRLRRDESGPAAVIEWPGVRGGQDLFRSFVGGNGLRMALAAKVIKAHGGEATHEADTIRVRLPLTS
ncbi:MAG: hypothetical protein ACRD68_11515, partial [Pyrinomonadaceae bacterium]